MPTLKDVRTEFFNLSQKEQELVFKEIYNFSKDIKQFLNTRLAIDNDDAYYIDELEDATDYYTHTGIPKILSTRKINSIISKAKKAKISIDILEKMEYIAFTAYMNALNDFGDGPDIYEDKTYDHLKNYLSLILKNNLDKDLKDKINNIQVFLLKKTNMHYDHIWDLFHELTDIDLREC